MDDLTTVYFQNGKRLKFHYDFGTKFVPEFDDMTHMQFDSVTLFNSGRRAVMGAVLYSEKNSEYAIQFVGQDRLPASMVRFLWQQVDDAIEKPDMLRAVHANPRADRCLRRSGKRAGGNRRAGGVGASMGDRHGCGLLEVWQWPLGFCRRQDCSAFRAGDLTSDDILLTDHVPAEIPRVAASLR